MKPALPDPVIEEFQGKYILRDDLLPGGTKRRAIPALLGGAVECVYASPAFGYAQLALAYGCRDYGKRATVFVAARKELHARTLEAKQAGAKIVIIRPGYLSNVQAKARAYAETTGARLLPFGFNDQRFSQALIEVARALPIQPTQIWSVAGSGTLTRALQSAWPSAEAFAIRNGSAFDPGRAEVINAAEKYERPALMPPPFPSCAEYDAKAWRYFEERAKPGALFWNVGA